MEKIAIISGRYPKSKFDSYINHKIYADTFNYSYIHCNWPTKKNNRYLNKIQYILQYIDAYDYIVWLDDDAFFFDFTKDIMQYAPQGNHFISICKSPDFKTLKTFFNSGDFIVKSNSLSKKFFTDVSNGNLNLVKRWWTDELGFFSNGDQDIMIYLLKTNAEYKDGYCLYNYKAFNSRYENLFKEDTHKPLILHFTGKPEVKMANYKKVQNKYNLHSSLVPKEFLSKYSLVKENKKSKSIFKRIIKKVLK